MTFPYLRTEEVQFYNTQHRDNARSDEDIFIRQQQDHAAFGAMDVILDHDLNTQTGMEGHGDEEEQCA